MGFSALLAVADRAALQHLGDTVRYWPSSGEPVEVRGIFDASYVSADVGAQHGVVSASPAVFLRLGDLPTDPETDDPKIEVAGDHYQVREPRKDGKGGVLLILQRL